MSAALDGRRILVTRAPGQSGRLVAALTSRGAIPVPFPTIIIEHAPLSHAAITALEGAAAFDWIVFTSANAVGPVFDRLPAWRNDTGARVAAVGTATARELAGRGVRTDAIPAEFRGSRIVEAMGEVRGCRVLLPQGQLAGAELAERLRSAGAAVVPVTVYRTLPAPLTAAHRAALAEGFDAATFTSGSTVRNFAAMVGDPKRALDGAVVACIGPATTDAARASGLVADVQPAEYTVEALVAGLAAFWDGDAAPRHAE